MMPLLKDGLSFKPLLNSFTDVIFHHSVVVLLLTQCCAGQSQVVGPSQPIVATVGDDIILPCRLDPAADASDMTVEWSRSDLDPRFVHVWRDGVELENKKHPSYKGRTSVSINNLRHGDVSLKLSKVKLSDDGKYKCFIPTLGRESTVDLVVGSVSSPQINISKVSSGVILQCESKGWYPEPEVVWLDGEGNLLSAGPTETVRGPDGLYTVSSRVTVEKRHSNNFTCRVQQKDIHQTRETHIYVPDDVFLVPSSSAVRIGINFAVCFLCVLVLVFAVWKRRQPKIKIRNNMSEDEAEPGEKKITYNSVAELQFLIEEGRDGELHMTGKEKIEYLKRKMKKLSEALQRNKEEEYKDVVHAVDSLKEYKEALDKHKSELNHLSGCMNNQLVLVKRLLKEAVLSTTKTNYMEMIEELWKRIEATKNLLEITEKLLQRTEEEIGQKTARKHELELLKEQINKTLQENQRAETQEELQTEQPEREEG